MPSVSVSFLPSLLESNELTGGVAVVIDVLRATTTIIHALANGATEVLCCESVEEARRLARSLPRNSTRLGGEREGRRIDGFDLDNSPLNYSVDAVSGKTIVFTTTNGTRALQHCHPACQTLIAAFVNVSAVAQRLRELQRNVQIICSGTDRQLTAEDVLCAGSIVDKLQTAQPGHWPTGNVQAQLARDFFQARSVNSSTLRQAVYESLGGRNLVSLGMQRDIDRSLEIDRFDFVPEWDPVTQRIRH